MPAAKGCASTPLGPKIPKILATFVYASSQGQGAHSAWTKIVATFVYASARTPLGPIKYIIQTQMNQAGLSNCMKYEQV